MTVGELNKLNAQALIQLKKERGLTDDERERAQDIIDELEAGRVTDMRRAIIKQLRSIISSSDTDVQNNDEPPLLISKVLPPKSILPNNPIDEAIDYRDTLARLNITQAQLSSMRGKSERYISDRLKLLQLPPDVQKQLRVGDIRPNGKLVKSTLKNLKSGLPIPSADLCISVDVGLSLCAILHRFDPTVPITDLTADLTTLKQIIEDHADVVLTILQKSESE